MKPIYALYAGAVLALVGLAGGGLAVLTAPEPTPAAKRVAGARPKAVVRPAPVETPPARPPGPSQEEKEANTTRLLLAQIEGTPEQIDAAWLKDFCLYIDDEAALEAYIAQVYGLGRQRDRVDKKIRLASKKLGPADPRYYFEQARRLIYKRDTELDVLLKKARSYLALGLFRQYEKLRSEDEQERLRLVRQGKGTKAAAKADSIAFMDLDPEFAFSFFEESIALYQRTVELAEAAGEDTAELKVQLAKAREGLIVDRWVRIETGHRRARQRLKGTGSSAKAVLDRTGKWQKAIHEHLLALGMGYVAEAAAETVYKERQQEAANRAFRGLAMVYQATHSGEALEGIHQVNEIQRYNLRQMGRANWRAAKAALKRGEIDEAKRLYFIANQRYLQCLAKLEVHARDKVLAEYRLVKQEMAPLFEGEVALAVEAP